MALLTDERSGSTKPSLWDQALKAVKGDSTSALVEQFTQEMTLVAEGLCEDQARLRKAVDGLLKEAEGQQTRSEQDYQELKHLLDAQEKSIRQRMDELSHRLDALEKPAPKEKKPGFHLGSDLVSRLTLLAGIVCGTWLIVTVLKLFM